MLITKELIQLDLETKTKEETIQALAQLAMNEGRLSDLETFVKAAIKREEEYSTGIGFGVAHSHGKSDAVKTPFLAFGRVQNVDWNSMDQAPVNNVFLIGVPASEAGTEHLKILAKISRQLMKKEFRSQLNEAKTGDDVLNLLKDI